MYHTMSVTRNRERGAEWALLLVALVVAIGSARPYAGSWNDGSRLATVESLVDRHSWVIDDSIFVRVPPLGPSASPLPYDVRDRGLCQHGTLDKLFISGHYYSDKSPVPALLMAGCYQVWQWLSGETAASHPDHFCWVMTLSSSGMAYVTAIWCLYGVGRRLGLSLGVRLLLTASLGLATVALPYTQHVNNHILLLAVSFAITVEIAAVHVAMSSEHLSRWRLARLGSLAGLGYTIDLGAGPVFLLCTAIFMLRSALRNRRPNSCWHHGLARFGLYFVLPALPWLVLHHALNYSLGGTFKPANANPEYFRWPGSPFAVGNLTGNWIHPSVGSFLLYAASMVGGKRGFLGHNLPLFLTIPGFFLLFRRHQDLRPGLWWALGCCGGTWLLYAATSNNSSGQCCSIRWFVPLLAPGYWMLALLLQRLPSFRLDLLLLSIWGILLVALMRKGPWMGGMVPLFWPLQLTALGTWLLSWRWRRHSLELVTQHPYTNGLGNSSPPGAASLLLWITKPSSSGARANTTSATSTSTCPATSSSSSRA